MKKIFLTSLILISSISLCLSQTNMTDSTIYKSKMHAIDLKLEKSFSGLRTGTILTGIGVGVVALGIASPLSRAGDSQTPIKNKPLLISGGILIALGNIFLIESGINIRIYSFKKSILSQSLKL